MRTLIILSFMCLFLYGCATTNNSPQSSQSWVGKNTSALTAALGQPNVKSQGSNGNTSYVYVTRTASLAPSTQSAVTVVAPGGHAIGVNVPNPRETAGSSLLECIVTYEANPQGVIVNVRKQGGNC